MAIWDLWSKRERRKKRQGQEDVFRYDDLPQPLRVKIIHIWADALGAWDDPVVINPASSHLPNVWWVEVDKVITREKGVFQLTGKRGNPFVQCQQYLQDAEVDDALDLIEVTFRFADQVVRRADVDLRRHYQLTHPDAAIRELNGRFREHGVGYEFAGGEIIRVDSEFVHAEAVKPALALLHDAGRGFSGPLDEFLAAHAKYRKGEHKEAIVEACKAFESTLKAVCSARRWPFDPQKDTASKLIEIVLANGLVPPYTQGQFTAVRAALESGVPTVRNKTSGHGQGATPTEVPGHLARYVLHLTASNIVFLIESHRALS
jgi:hypothetical protein